MSPVSAVPNAREIWDEALSTIRGRIPRQSFDNWFRPLSLESIEGSRIKVLLPNRFFKEWFEDHYVAILKTVLEDLMFSKVEVVFRIPEQETQTGTDTRGEGSARRPVRRHRNEVTYLNPKYTFETFVVGTSNQFVHAGCLAVGEQLSKAYNPLFIYGGVGLGKTHLLHAIGHLVLRRNNRLRLSYVSSEKFTNDLINAIRFDSTVEFRNRYRSLDLLLIDDIQFIAGKERTQEEFFHTFNDLYDSAKQIVISSDSLPREIPTLEERLSSRFEWGLIADIQPPDLETKAAILRKKAQAEAVRLPDEVSLFIAKNVQSNIRELEGSLVRLIAYASLTGREISLELAQETLKELNAERAKVITLGAIQRAVADFFRVKVEDLKSKERNQGIVLPRQVAMYLSRTMTPSSLPAIGEAFGGKDHTTVIHACEKIKRRLAGDDGFRRQIESLTQSIGS
ncbi:MAG: chromosomal replication initiator protein DnaA [Candidatus Methylomirabilis oxyfera]|nr:chromosomal replication initiator protein DnaA [Candidatus Methylomirabilis oxyfera]